MFLSKQTKFQPNSIERINSLKDTPLASFGRRSIAFMIDFIIVVLIIIIATLAKDFHKILSAAANKSANLHYDIDPFHGWSILAFVLYSGLVTYFGKGQSLGKMIMRIKVISLTHEHISLWHSIERALGYGASALEGGFGFIQYFIHPNHQTVHDRIAETIVISVKKNKNLRST